MLVVIRSCYSQGCCCFSVCVYLFIYFFATCFAILQHYDGGLHQISLSVKLPVMANVWCMSCHNKATNCHSQLLFKFLKPLRSTFFQVIFNLKKIEKKWRHDIFLVSCFFFPLFFSVISLLMCNSFRHLKRYVLITSKCEINPIYQIKNDKQQGKY